MLFMPRQQEQTTLLCSWCRNRFQEDVLTEAKRLLDKGYYQTSRSFRMLARLPEGKTAHQALTTANNEPWTRGLTAACAGDYYLRVHAPKEDRVILKCDRVFRAFRALGGGTYLAARRDR